MGEKGNLTLLVRQIANSASKRVFAGPAAGCRGGGGGVCVCVCWEEEDEFGRTIGTSVALLFEPKVCTKKKATSVVNGGEDHTFSRKGSCVIIEPKRG